MSNGVGVIIVADQKSRNTNNDVPKPTTLAPSILHNKMYLLDPTTYKYNLIQRFLVDPFTTQLLLTTVTYITTSKYNGKILSSFLETVITNTVTNVRHNSSISTNIKLNTIFESGPFISSYLYSTKYIIYNTLLDDIPKIFTSKYTITNIVTIPRGKIDFLQPSENIMSCRETNTYHEKFFMTKRLSDSIIKKIVTKEQNLIQVVVTEANLSDHIKYLFPSTATSESLRTPDSTSNLKIHSAQLYSTGPQYEPSQILSDINLNLVKRTDNVGDIKPSAADNRLQFIYSTSSKFLNKRVENKLISLQTVFDMITGLLQQTLLKKSYIPTKSQIIKATNVSKLPNFIPLAINNVPKSSYNRNSSAINWKYRNRSTDTTILSNIFDHKNEVTNHKFIINKSPTLTNGIRIRPGEIIATNLDVIVGKPIESFSLNNNPQFFHNPGNHYIDGKTQRPIIPVNTSRVLYQDLNNDKKFLNLNLQPPWVPVKHTDPKHKQRIKIFPPLPMTSYSILQNKISNRNKHYIPNTLLNQHYYNLRTNLNTNLNIIEAEYSQLYFTKVLEPSVAQKMEPSLILNDLRQNNNFHYVSPTTISSYKIRSKDSPKHSYQNVNLQKYLQHKDVQIRVAPLVFKAESQYSSTDPVDIPYVKITISKNYNYVSLTNQNKTALHELENIPLFVDQQTDDSNIQDKIVAFNEHIKNKTKKEIEMLPKTKMEKFISPSEIVIKASSLQEHNFTPTIGYPLTETNQATINQDHFEARDSSKISTNTSSNHMDMKRKSSKEQLNLLGQLRSKAKDNIKFSEFLLKQSTPKVFSSKTTIISFSQLNSKVVNSSRSIVKSSSQVRNTYEAPISSETKVYEFHFETSLVPNKTNMEEDIADFRSSNQKSNLSNIFGMEKLKTVSNKASNISSSSKAEGKTYKKKEDFENDIYKLSSAKVNKILADHSTAEEKKNTIAESLKPTTFKNILPTLPLLKPLQDTSKSIISSEYEISNIDLLKTLKSSTPNVIQFNEVISIFQEHGNTSNSQENRFSNPQRTTFKVLILPHISKSKKVSHSYILATKSSKNIVTISYTKNLTTKDDRQNNVSSLNLNPIVASIPVQLPGFLDKDLQIFKPSYADFNFNYTMDSTDISSESISQEGKNNFSVNQMLINELNCKHSENSKLSALKDFSMEANNSGIVIEDEINVVRNSKQQLIGEVIVVDPEDHTSNKSKSSELYINNSTVACYPSCKLQKNEYCKIVKWKPTCICRPGFGRLFSDHPCKPIFSYEISLKVHESIPSNHINVTDYVISDIWEAIHSILIQSDFRDAFQGLYLKRINNNYDNKTLLVKALLQFSNNSNIKGLERVLQKYIRKNNNMIRGYKTIYNLDSTNDFHINDFDECSENQYNDCSANSICVNSHGSYTCTCKDGFVDTSLNDLYPGRLCTKDHNGCGKCNFHGNCITHNDKGKAFQEMESQIVCECFKWYGGSKCQVNLKVLLLSCIAALPLIVGVFSLCLILKMKKQKNTFYTQYLGISNKNQQRSKKNIFATQVKAINQKKLSSVLQIIRDSKSESSYTSEDFFLKKLGEESLENVDQLMKNSVRADSEYYSCMASNYTGKMKGISDRSVTIVIPRAKYCHTSLFRKSKLFEPLPIGSRIDEVLNDSSIKYNNFEEIQL